MGKGPVSKQTRGLPPLVRALAFGCILLALLLCAQEVLAPKGGCIDGFYAEPEDTIDVIFLGSSHANAAFAPAQMWREQGFTGYVLYSWSQPMWVSYHYAVEAFKRQTPRVVVLEGFGLCYGTTYMTPADVDGTSDDYSLRIPLNREHDVVLKTLGVPQGWMTPCFIGIGYPKEDELVLEQYDSSPDGHIHMGGW